MDRIRNPFTAALGVSPAVLAGREEELDLITMAMLDGPGAHERVSVVSGARGSGKTVFLNAVEDRASQLDWTIISETATQGVVERIRNTAERNLQEFSPADKRRLSGISIAGIGSINWETDPISPTQSSLRTALTALLDAKAQLDSITGQPPSGVLITLDELHYTNRDEIIEFATTIQHLLRENREITVIMAGIPSAVKPLLSRACLLYA
ncbi:TPA: ATP-binding protein [Corynebacterium striatum]|nr:ATP-binding protein [Corynebacterium striatum]HAT1320292.1 ATP-binding protein [Corynebacterium striatum]HAT1419050.1 ATP-binding protein [Corynebacterium striatum]HAT6642263.1 ATP-binding protein [Corynebacterium striatum]